MAQMAQRDQAKRTVEVDRMQLIEKLTANRIKHVKDYEEAMATYKTVLLGKIDKAFDDTEAALRRKRQAALDKVANLTDADIAEQPDYVTLVDQVNIEMKVPRSFAEDYDAAIDMAKCDVRPTLELTHAEFTCFMRDKWDWKSGFDDITLLYKRMG